MEKVYCVQTIMETPFGGKFECFSRKRFLSWHGVKKYITGTCRKNDIKTPWVDKKAEFWRFVTCSHRDAYILMFIVTKEVES